MFHFVEAETGDQRREASKKLVRKSVPSLSSGVFLPGIFHFHTSETGPSQVQKVISLCILLDLCFPFQQNVTEIAHRQDKRCPLEDCKD
jgi:hypothetical protein